MRYVWFSIVGYIQFLLKSPSKIVERGALAYASLYNLHIRSVKGGGKGAHTPCAPCLNPPMGGTFAYSVYLAITYSVYYNVI